MMRKNSVLLAILCVCLVSTASAHLAPLVTDSMALGDSKTVDHYETKDNTDNTAEDNLIDQSEMKGTFSVTLTNTGTEAWGDFHFAITGYTDVYFTTGPNDEYPEMNGSTMLSDDFVIGTNDAGYATIDLYFYDNPVEQDETVSFVIYTDNTQSGNSWFGVCMHPTPVPEPATLAILGLGSLALICRKR